MARSLTPEQMVMPKAFAPFEVAECFARWNELMRAEAKAQGADLDKVGEDDPSIIVIPAVCDGLGPPWPLLGERPSDFGERCAVALFHLIKEI